MGRSSIQYVLITLKGMAMGAADVVPGVSGGTIAFISGIYEELIESIDKLNLTNLKKIRSHGFKVFWNSVNGSFLLALFSGIAISILSLAKLIKWLLQNEPVLLWSFFFGLVVASIVFIGKQIKTTNFFWRTYDQQELDWLEEKSDSLAGFEFKWNERKKSKIPTAFAKAYPEASFEVINKQNYLEFVT